MSDISKLFEQESRDKKRIGRGVHNRASRTGRVSGGVITPVDLLKGKAKKEYMGNGPVIVYKLEEKEEIDMISYEEFKQKDKVEQVEVFKNLESTHGKDIIKRTWGVSNSVYNGWRYRLGLTEKYPQRSRTKNKVEVEDLMANKKDKIITPGLTITLVGEFTGDQLSQRLDSISVILDKGIQYSLNLILKEERLK